MTPRRRARRHWVRRLLGLVAMVLLGWLVWEAATWPDVRALATQPPTTTAFIERYKERERAAGRTPRVAIRWTPYGAISPHVKRAVLVAEDINFFSHHHDWQWRLGAEWGEQAVWQLWQIGAVQCVMVSCCTGAELQLREDGEIVFRELYPTKSDLYERARNLRKAHEGTQSPPRPQRAK